jgi:transcriptional regulator with AAA-type ATPase domain
VAVDQDAGTGDAALRPDLDQIQAIWKEHSAEYATQGRMSVAKLMESAHIRLDERRPGGVEVVVENSIQQELLKNEMPAFRERLNRAGVLLAALHLRLEPGTAGSQAKAAPYTSQEKLAQMVGKNPAVQQLRDQLGLELEF